METCKSPRKVMIAAWHLACRALPDYASKFSRHDFTLPQLFACLVVREHQKKTYRGVEALLNDAPDWCAQIGMSKIPDHNTLWRAFNKIVTLQRTNKMLDVTADWFTEARVLDLASKPAAADSTHFESHHVSRHFEHRRNQTAKKAAEEEKKPKQQKHAQDKNNTGKKNTGKNNTGEKNNSPAARPGVKRADKSSVKSRSSAEKDASAVKDASAKKRSTTNKNLPKATMLVAANCHLILAIHVSTGSGSDAPSFDRLLYQAWRRVKGKRLKTVVADASFDSEPNHRIARLDMGVRSIIPPLTGRPRKDGGLPVGRYRRLMHQRFARKADAKAYGQRWQSETVHSMEKRNLGSALRAHTPRRRENEMLLRALTHNVML